MRFTLFIACALAVSCGSRQLDPPTGPVCTHPCDLAQTIWVNVVGAEPAAAVTVTGPCSGGVDNCGSSGCRMVNLYLSSAAGSPGDLPVVCHVKAVSPSGVVVERDVMANYTGGSCCAGYEFGWGASIEIDFSKVDAGIADRPGDAFGE